MGNINPNSTNYVHSYEPNTNDLTMAMGYNANGEPVLRTVTSGITIEGDVNVDKVRLWDGTNDLYFDAANTDGEASPLVTLPTESHNMVFNGTTWCHR